VTPESGSEGVGYGTSGVEPSGSTTTGLAGRMDGWVVG
jgi:hypothetical protein